MKGAGHMVKTPIKTRSGLLLEPQPPPQFIVLVLAGGVFYSEGLQAPPPRHYRSATELIAIHGQGHKPPRRIKSLGHPMKWSVLHTIVFLADVLISHI